MAVVEVALPRAVRRPRRPAPPSSRTACCTIEDDDFSSVKRRAACARKAHAHPHGVLWPTRHRPQTDRRRPRPDERHARVGGRSCPWRAVAVATAAGRTFAPCELAGAVLRERRPGLPRPVGTTRRERRSVVVCAGGAQTARARAERDSEPATVADVNAHIVRLLVLTPLRIERAAVRRRLPGATVLCSGMGAADARAAAFVAAGMPADAVAVAGFCGAVAGGLRAGDIVVASEVRGPEGVTICDARSVVAALEAQGIGRISAGPIAWPTTSFTALNEECWPRRARWLPTWNRHGWPRRPPGGRSPSCASCSIRRLARSTGRWPLSPAPSRPGGRFDGPRRPWRSGPGMQAARTERAG